MNAKTLRFLKWVAAGFGSGWLPKAPGTWGSLFALIPAYFILEGFGLQGLWWATLMVTIVGFVVCYYLLPELTKRGESHDPGWIVIDEWAGLWLCIAIILSFTPSLKTLPLFILAFILFRAFDIFKPFPIKNLENWGPYWFSIMNDDLLAGLIGAWLGIIMLLTFL